MQKRRLAAPLFLSLGLTLAGGALAQGQPRPAEPPARAGAMSPETFSSEAAQINLAEMRLGQLATQRASNEEVRQYGQMLFEEHAMAGNDLGKISEAQDFSLPPEPNMQQQELYQRLSQLSGPEFDQQFLAEMITAHQQAISLYQQASTALENEPLRQYAATTLPRLQEHLRVAQDLQSRLSQQPGQPAQPGQPEQPAQPPEQPGQPQNP